MKYTCDLNLRPRVEGKPVLLEAGIPFDEELVCAESLKELVKQGHARVYEPEAEVVETVQETTETIEVEEAPEHIEEEVVEEVKDKPTGIWNYKREEIENFDIDVLNMMYKERAKEFDLSVRAMTNKDNLLDKLTSES